jgi:hypothetical protein
VEACAGTGLGRVCGLSPEGAPTVSGADACAGELYSAAAVSSIRSRVRDVSSLMPGPIVEAIVIERM